MPKLLFIAYSFPPNSLPGSIRAWNITKQLSLRGWDVTVVTPRPEYWRSGRNTFDVDRERRELGITRLLTAIRMPFLDNINTRPSENPVKRPVERAIRFAARHLGYEPQIGWYSEVLTACGRFKEHEFDIVMGTGSPFLSFELARRIAHRLNAKYVIDYRDLWSGNPHASSQYSRRTRKLESTIVEDAGAITVIGPSMKECVEDLFGGEERIHVIPNGFDLDALSIAKATNLGHFALGYGGIFYPPMRSVTPLFEALRILDGFNSGVDWRFHYWGPQSGYVQAEANRAGIAHRITLHGAVGHARSLDLTASVSLSVVITSINDSCGKAERGIVTSKLFEAIGLGTQVLLISPANGDASKFLGDAKAGSQFSGSQVEAIAQFVSEELAKGRRCIVPAETFNWSAIGSNLDNILRRVVATL